MKIFNHPWGFKGKVIRRETTVDDPKSRIWRRSRYSAKARGILHTISLQDLTLPVHCPLLGVKLDYSPGTSGRGCRSLNRACIDRIDNRKGYIPGNVQVISFRANIVKSNLTPEELIRFARGILAMLG